MTVVDRIRQRENEHPSSVAVIEGARTLTHAELYERVDRLSDALHRLGLEKGDRLLAYLPNETEAIECELAALQSGIVWVTLNPRLTWPEVRGVIVACQPKLLVTNAESLARLVAGTRALPLEPMPVVAQTRSSAPSGEGSLEAPLSYEALLADAEPRRLEVAVAAHDVARLRYTSGTTGSAKAAILSHRVYEACLDNLLDVLHPLTGTDRALHVAPLTHGSAGLLYPALGCGGANVLLDRFDASEVLSIIERERITMMFTVPTILSRLIAAPTFEESDLSSLKSLVYGGAPMPETQLRRAVQKLGPTLLHIYGMSEAPWPITALKQPEHRLDNPHLRSIGKPTRHCELRIVGDDGRALDAGPVGEIQVRGGNVMTGYFGDEAATRSVLHDGWLSTGDLGKVDDDGYYYIVDRKKDVVISGGFNVYAKEVEAALCEDDRVLEAAVVGEPDSDWGEIVVAFVVSKPNMALTAEDVHSFAKGRLSGYKCPRRVEVVEELPKNSSGKVIKGELVRSLRRQ